MKECVNPAFSTIIEYLTNGKSPRLGRGRWEFESLILDFIMASCENGYLASCNLVNVGSNPTLASIVSIFNFNIYIDGRPGILSLIALGIVGRIVYNII